jgi:hypothetical protein
VSESDMSIRLDIQYATKPYTVFVSAQFWKRYPKERE